MAHEPPVKPAVRILRKASNVTHHFFAPCPRGLAPALAGELTALGAKDARAAEAGVAFSGEFDLVYGTNLHSRIASRILWRVGQFPYKTEDDVYEGAKAVRWRERVGWERRARLPPQGVGEFEE